MTEKEKYVASLREIANFYEGASDELPRPVINRECFSLAATIIPVILKDCKRVEKAAVGGYIELRKALTYGALVFNFAQDKVCERKVVGQTWVPEYKTEAHFVDQVEWECKPILKSVGEEK